MAKKKILLLAEQESILLIAGITLKKEGFDVSQSLLHQDDLERILNWEPDLILLDILMHGVNLIEACRWLKSDPRTKSAPLILYMQDVASGQCDLLCKRLGADSWLVRSFDTNLLVSQIKDLLGIARIRQQKKIVIIDNNPHVARLLALQLEKNGYQVFTAQDGVAGLRLIFQEAPDLVISEVIISGFSGAILGDKIRANPRTTHVPIVYLSVLPLSEAEKRGIIDQTSHYLRKPYEPKILLGLIEEILT